uniref:Uncharacterized protein n=1 Tax=Accipiter nisus TaxID=211598 RepID=A0A8B9MBL6_9AVES
MSCRGLLGHDAFQQSLTVQEIFLQYYERFSFFFIKGGNDGSTLWAAGLRLVPTIQLSSYQHHPALPPWLTPRCAAWGSGRVMLQHGAAVGGSDPQQWVGHQEFRWAEQC